MSEPVVLDRADELRYVALIDGEQVGTAGYRRAPGKIVFTHTEVEPDREGEGVGSALASFALDDARSRGLGVVPLCPFIRGWIQRHPDYADLVVSES